MAHKNKAKSQVIVQKPSERLQSAASLRELSPHVIKFRLHLWREAWGAKG